MIMRCGKAVTEDRSEAVLGYGSTAREARAEAKVLVAKKEKQFVRELERWMRRVGCSGAPKHCRKVTAIFDYSKVGTPVNLVVRWACPGIAHCFGVVYCKPRKPQLY